MDKNGEQNGVPIEHRALFKGMIHELILQDTAGKREEIFAIKPGQYNIGPIHFNGHIKIIHGTVAINNVECDSKSTEQPVIQEDMIVIDTKETAVLMIYENR